MLELAAGCWLLAAGCWLLAAGNPAEGLAWLLAAGNPAGGRRGWGRVWGPGLAWTTWALLVNPGHTGAFLVTHGHTGSQVIFCLSSPHLTPEFALNFIKIL